MIHLIHLQSGSNAPLVGCFFLNWTDTAFGKGHDESKALRFQQVEYNLRNREHKLPSYEKTNNTIYAWFGTYAIFGNKRLTTCNV